MPTKAIADLLARICIFCHIFYRNLFCLCKSSAIGFIKSSAAASLYKNSVSQMTSYIQELHKNLSTDNVLIFDSQNRAIRLFSCPHCPAQHSAQSRRSVNVKWLSKWRDGFLFVTWYHFYLLKKDRFIRRPENRTTDCSHLVIPREREKFCLPVFTCQPYWGSLAFLNHQHWEKERYYDWPKLGCFASDFHGASFHC